LTFSFIHPNFGVLRNFKEDIVWGLLFAIVLCFVCCKLCTTQLNNAQCFLENHSGVVIAKTFSVAEVPKVPDKKNHNCNLKQLLRTSSREFYDC